MERDCKTYQDFLSILDEELIVAMGCTEPIAIALAAARARDLLGETPDEVIVEASGSIIKNVKSVIVPNTDYLKGLDAAAAAGIISGNAHKDLEVLAEVTPEQIAAMQNYLHTASFIIRPLDLGPVFDLIVTVKANGHSARVRIAHFHTNIVLEEKDGEVLLEKTVLPDEDCEGLTPREELTIQNIWDFVNTMDIEDVRGVIQRQIDCNMAVAEEGLRNPWGARVGATLLDIYDDNIRTKAKAYAAAGSDARMNGCEMPVVINSGSGNQGLTVCVPVVMYARHYEKTEEELLRALTLANLTAIHLKDGIGRLSAYCGAVGAGAGAGAGIAYLLTKDYETVAQTVEGAIVIASGIVCDGAKSSCAAKIATSVDAALLAFNMSLKKQRFNGGDGLVGDTLEETIGNITHLGKDGMKGTNEVIINIMTGIHKEDSE